MVSFSEGAVPFTMYLNYDKPFIGLFLLVFLIRPWTQGKWNPKSFFSYSLISLAALLIIIVPLALLSGYLSFQFKVPTQTLIWGINNLLVVCVAEEVFFRGFLQNGFCKFFKRYSRLGDIIGLCLASLLFGLAHYKGGNSYIILSAIAGFFYGLAYLKTKRIEASILVHFLLNTCLLYTSPSPRD